MRMIAVYHKGEALRQISHLDIQRTLHRAFRRARLPLAYSQGFNPHPEFSFASALATGASSDAEWFSVALAEEMDAEDFCARVNAVLPEGLWLSHAKAAPERMPTLSSAVRAAEYRVLAAMERALSGEAIEAAIASLLDGEIIVEKRTKGGIKPVDLRPQIYRVLVEKVEGDEITLRVLGKLQSDGGLRVELLLGALFDRLGARGQARFCRSAMYFDSDGLLPRLPC